jgi:hypothetical protein
MKGKDRFEDLGLDGKVKLNWIINMYLKMWTVFVGFYIVSVVGLRTR